MCSRTKFDYNLLKNKSYNLLAKLLIYTHTHTHYTQLYNPHTKHRLT